VDRVYCPYCRNPDSRVIDSRTAEDGAAIRRRRSCPACSRRFTTQETVILMVGKRSGVTEPFNRDKIVRGVRRACQGRPVSEDQLAILAQRVEDVIRSRGSGEVPSHEVGLAILGPLRELDEVAYLRFASVYRGFESLADFEEEIAGLRREHDRRWLSGDEDGPRRSPGDGPGDGGPPAGGPPAGGLRDGDPPAGGPGSPASREAAEPAGPAGPAEPAEKQQSVTAR
jgi:transcriptional repressor NrdR